MKLLPLGDRIKWLGEKPNLDTTRAIIVIAEETTPTAKPKRTTPTHLIGKAKILGDIVSPIVDEDDWEGC